jgi:amidophosphoribosyltransferase
MGVMADCGVIALSATSDMIKELFTGLVFLQHRGQSHAGICTRDSEGAFHLHKGAGLVLDVFDNKSLAQLNGKIGIGHVRYPTVGSGNGDVEAQPIKSQQLPDLVLAHNGNLPNFAQIKADFSKKGIEFKSSCDVEAVVEVFASNLIKAGYVSGKNDNDELIYEAVGQTMDVFETGSFSVVGIVGNKLIAFRDKRGIKPFVGGTRVTSEGLVEHAFASESVGLTQIGFTKKNVWNVRPGHCYILDGPEIRNRRVRSADRLARCIFEDAYFSSPASWIDGMSVSKRRGRIGKVLADEFFKAFPSVVPDIVAPVPDTARTPAIDFARRLSILHRDHIPYKEVIIRNRYMGLRSFIEMSQKHRELLIGLKNIYDVRNVPSTLVLVDDSIVRMTTMKQIAKKLKELGVENLYLAICFPPIKDSCYYGIDFPSKDQLIAANMNIEQMQKELGVDGLYYISIEGYLRAIATARDEACLGCTEGEHPTDIPEDQKRSCAQDGVRRY